MSGRRTPAPGTPHAAAVWALVVALAALTGAAAWPIYQTPRVWVLVGIAAATAGGLVWAGLRWRWGATAAAALLLGFVALLVPLAVPDALGADPQRLLRGLGDGLGAVALGWKQILTLTLPLGEYQAVLVPLLVTVYLAAAAAVWLALRSARSAVWAAFPALAGVAFGTLLGPAELSEPLTFGPATIAAPRELALWGAAGLLIALWIGWTSGAARRAALRLGRGPGSRSRGLRRGAVGAGIVLVALAAGAAVAPALATSPRVVPRDRIDPVIVVREQTSPLASYRLSKRDAALTAPLFRVASEGPLPSRLRLAVLDHFDGVDLTPTAGAGSFTRFPSGVPVPEPSQVEVAIDSGYRGIWVPLGSGLGAPPEFGGPRAAELSDAFYLDRDTGAGIAVPTAAGLRAGDTYVAELSAAADPSLGERPAADAPRIDLASHPQLDRWLRAQQLPASGQGLRDGIERLRDRGYLSHALSDDMNREWLDRLAAESGTRFVASAGGHSTARVEELFAQLNEQEERAGATANAEALVAGVGDDEQFAAAAMLLAHAMGFDARVVLGVRIGGEGVPGVPACTDTCAGEHLAAWIEARGADGVWAPLDVTPQVVVPPRSLDTGERLPEFPTVPEERDAPERDPEFGAGLGDVAPQQPGSDRRDAAAAPVLRWVGWGAAALLLTALAVLFVPAVKWVRRRSRRRAPTPETRVLGAWEEFLDAHVDAGTPALREAARAPGARSRRDLARALPGGPPIADAVDRAVFAPTAPSAAEAEEVWGAVGAETERIRSEQSRWERLRARFTLASFGVGGSRGGRR